MIGFIMTVFLIILVHGTSTIRYNKCNFLNIDFSPTLQKYPVQSHMVGALNGEIIIMCKPEAAPAPTITWTKNSISISPDGNRIKLMPNGNLQIKDLTYGDAGFYTCIADNGIPPAAKSTGQLVIQCMSLSYLLWNSELVIRKFLSEKVQ